jgi:hypothetical protein
MSTLQLELGEFGEAGRCACCNATSRTVHGFVYRDGDAYAVYYGGWSDGHPERGVSLAIAVGEWTEGTSPADRVSIGMIAMPTPSSVNFGVLNPTESPWGDTPLLGKMLERAQALTHPALKAVMHVAEHVVLEDTRVRRFLDSVEMP